jgi:SAM-dependent methyltransferase
MAAGDRWASWLIKQRDGGAAIERERTHRLLAPIRDRILDAAMIRPRECVLDVGCGDGLLGLRALELGADVIFSDISEDCLDLCRTIVAGQPNDAEEAGTPDERARNQRGQASYRHCSAEDLGPVEADVIVLRSVLMYVADKRRAFSEFFRVLRPGGRVSLFEPINRFGAAQRRATLGGFDVTGVEPLAQRVREQASRLSSAPRQTVQAMTDFDEYDLFEAAERAGFERIRLDTAAELKPETMINTRSWDTFLDSSPNPLAPTWRQAIASALSASDARRLEACLKPQIEEGRGTTRLATAFLFAAKA